MYTLHELTLHNLDDIAQFMFQGHQKTIGNKRRSSFLDFSQHISSPGLSWSYDFFMKFNRDNGVILLHF